MQQYSVERRDLHEDLSLGGAFVYLASDVDARIDELERALRSACLVMSRMKQSHYDIGNLATQAFIEAEKALGSSS